MTDPEPLAFPHLKPLTVEMTAIDVDPAVMELLTGVRADGSNEPVEQSLHVVGEWPAKRRTFWEWLTRKPKHQPIPYSYFFPRVRVEAPEVSRNQKESER